VPANGVTLLPGDPKLAKSTLALDLAAKLSRGEIGDPERAPTSIVVTGEDSVAEVVEPRVAAAGGKLCHVHVLDVTDPEAVFTLPEHVPDLEERIYEIGAQLAIVDPLNRFLAETVDGHKDQSIRRAMGPLHQVAERQKCAILVVAHLNKGMGSNPLYRVGGSIGLTGAARSVMLFAKDPDDPEGERGRYRILAQAGLQLWPAAAVPPLSD
jgi:predicted ATP-dependent serine protease